MTTTPSRIALIRPAIESALAQNTPVSQLELNVPDVSVRTGAPYLIPDWMQDIERLKIFRVGRDLGPITKIAPTLLRYRGDDETYIWSVDDDFAFAPNQLSLLLKGFDPESTRILVRYGGELKPDGGVQMFFGRRLIDVFEGFGGVFYPPGCIGDDFEKYVEATSANTDCRCSDDMVLSLYFRGRKVPIFLHNVPDEAPYMAAGALRNVSQVDPLRHSVGGNYQDIYKRVFAFVENLNGSVQ
jgi:hypothetical protein